MADRPLRDVLREVEEELLDAARDRRRIDIPLRDVFCLTQQLRAIAPLLRDLCVLATCNDVRGDDALVIRARALADELEAK